MEYHDEAPPPGGPPGAPGAVPQFANPSVGREEGSSLFRCLPGLSCRLLRRLALLRSWFASD